MLLWSKRKLKQQSLSSSKVFFLILIIERDSGVCHLLYKFLETVITEIN